MITVAECSLMCQLNVLLRLPGSWQPIKHPDAICPLWCCWRMNTPLPPLLCASVSGDLVLCDRPAITQCFRHVYGSYRWWFSVDLIHLSLTAWAALGYLWFCRGFGFLIVVRRDQDAISPVLSIANCIWSAVWNTHYTQRCHCCCFSHWCHTKLFNILRAP